MSLILGATLALTLARPVPIAAGFPQSHRSFQVAGNQFLLDGKPFVIRSGEMHYPRVPRAYWRDRMRKAKAMGLNTICTYVFWNLHEPRPGRFDFSGNLDLAAYIRTAKEEGLYVIVRPGPYICTELDFGGLPAWLQKDRTMRVRSNDPKFLRFTQRYFDHVGKIVKPLLIGNGGNVILTQVENEYGSYGSDHVYMAAIRDALIRAGFTGQLFTSDGPGQNMLNGGTLPGIPSVINFGGGAENAFKELAKFRPDGPRMVGEYWAGWFDHWGERHHTTSATSHAREIEWFLKNGISFNLYMFHGGTSFAFMPGANGDRNSYQPDITSYDYDSPLDESGRVTEKYRVFRDTIARATGESLPPVPETPAPIAVPSFDLVPDGVLLGRGDGKRIAAKRPLTFEELGQSYGMVAYEFKTALTGRQRLEIDRLSDYAMVLVDGRRVGELDRRLQQRSMDLDLPRRGASVTLLVESHARINFGHALPDERAGIDGAIRLGGQPIPEIVHYRYPLSSAPSMRYADLGTAAGDHPWAYAGSPRIYRGMFGVETVGDTFLDLGDWTKGYVWVNGHNLGRYWTAAGPQRTLYLPGCWLKKSGNRVVILDEGPAKARPALVGLSSPILNVRPVSALKPFRVSGQTVTLPEAFRSASGSFTPQPVWQTAVLSAEARYVALEVLSEHGQGSYASAAELEVLDEAGKPIRGMKVAYADSEELSGENGSAANLIDNQPTTMWHTEWSESQPGFPHVVILDLGATRRVSALRYLPRNDGPNGRIKEYRIYSSRTPFPGQ
jgi:beta-galactosidase